MHGTLGRGRGRHFQHGYNGTALERFVRNCVFDPGTGCVLWAGGQTSGRGHHAPYGSFWFERRRWFAHRWAAKHIHGLDIDGMQVDHCCDKDNPGMHPNTLCVQHVQALLPSMNRELQWVRTQVGLLPAPPRFEGQAFSEAPFFEAPAWLTLRSLR